MGEGPPEERPRWSFTWLVRLQRVGRNRPEVAADEQNAKNERVGRLLIYITLGAIGLIEVGIAMWLGVLPR